MGIELSLSECKDINESIMIKSYAYALSIEKDDSLVVAILYNDGKEDREYNHSIFMHLTDPTLNQSITGNQMKEMVEHILNYGLKNDHLVKIQYYKIRDYFEFNFSEKDEFPGFKLTATHYYGPWMKKCK